LEKILDIVDSIAHEKGLESENVREALKAAFIRTAQKVIGDKFDYEASLNNEKRSIDLFQKLEVVADDDERLGSDEDERLITVSEAREDGEFVDVGDELLNEITLEAFGRTASMTLHHEIEFHVQRLVEDVVYNKYKQRVGKIVNGTVTRVDGYENTYLEIGEIKAILPRKNRIKGESFGPGDVLKAIVRRVNISKKEGINIELSRTTPKFLEELLRLEVPEIEDGNVIIEKCARIPGERAKIALFSNRENIDPVGATVGVKGVRINAVSQELLGESIDVINYSPIPEIFISRAMAPAIVNNVTTTEEHHAKVMIGTDQKAKAIGKSGINIRLASMLTGFEIELVEQEGQAAPQGRERQQLQANEDGSPLLSSLFNEE
jgi:N utilization substance protein A